MSEPGNRPLATRQPRNLIICCDGTNNQFGIENTNVVRVIQVLERDPLKQRLYYDPGVGTLPESGLSSRGWANGCRR